MRCSYRCKYGGGHFERNLTHRMVVQRCIQRQFDQVLEKWRQKRVNWQPNPWHLPTRNYPQTKSLAQCTNARNHWQRQKLTHKIHCSTFATKIYKLQRWSSGILTLYRLTKHIFFPLKSAIFCLIIATLVGQWLPLGPLASNTIRYLSLKVKGGMNSWSCCLINLNPT